MKIGVGSYAFRWSIGFKDRIPSTPMSPIGLVDRVAELGAEVLQIADNLPLHLASVSELDRLAERSLEHGIDLEIGTDGASIDNLERYLSIAQRLRAGILRLTLNRDDLSASRDELFVLLRQVGDRYAAIGCTIAIENHFLVPTNELVELFEAVDHPAIGACVDVANSIATQEWPMETVRKLAPYARNLHLKDCRIEIDPYGVGMHVTGVPLGEGIIDVEAVFDALRDVGREPTAVLEHWLPFPSSSDGSSVTEVEYDWTRAGLKEASRFVNRPT